MFVWRWCPSGVEVIRIRETRITEYLEAHRIHNIPQRNTYDEAATRARAICDRMNSAVLSVQVAELDGIAGLRALAARIDKELQCQ